MMSSPNPFRFVLVGPPGAGKGTQAAWMSACFEIPTISSSRTLRNAVASGSPIGRQVNATMSSGGLVTDEVMNELVRQRLAEPDVAGGFVLDGFPRTVAQAAVLDEIVGEPPVVAIALHVPESEIEGRLIARRVCSRCRIPQSLSSHKSGQRDCAYCGAALTQRDDDAEATIKRRIFVYRSTVPPLLDYYRRSGRLIDIDASADPRTVSGEIARRVALRHAQATYGAAAADETQNTAS
jgi:adenylate kinase